MSITIKDVAKEAGVSISTVSKVVNNSSSISDATIKRVNEIMRRLNYYPNQIAKNFAKQSTGNIAFIAKIEKNIAFETPHLFEIMCGAQNALEKKGFNLSVISTDARDDECSVIRKIVSQHSADGLIIHASAVNRSLSFLLQETNFPHIILGKPDFESQLCWIDTNNNLSGEIAANHLCEMGYRKIAFMGGNDEDLTSLHRLQGFKNAMEYKNMHLNQDFILSSDSTKETSFQKMNYLLSLPQRADAIICANNNIALGVVQSIHAHNLNIPKDISVITFDDYPFSRIMEPMLTVVNIDVFDIGLQAGSMLLRKIKNRHLQVQTYTTLPSLIVRESTAMR